MWYSSYDRLLGGKSHIKNYDKKKKNLKLILVILGQ